MIFVIFHGSFGNPDENWYPELQNRLESLGQIVFVPHFPQEDYNYLLQKGSTTKISKFTLKNWLKTFDNIQKNFKNGEKICFIGHSISCVFILHLVTHFKIRLDSAIFVSPFLNRLPQEVWPYNRIVDDFSLTDIDSEKLKAFIPISYVLYSDNDPYVPSKQCKLFAQILDSSKIMVSKAKHMNAEVNMDEFMLVMDLCLTRLDLTFTQKFRFLRRELGAFEFINLNRGSGIITVSAEEAMTNGLVQFRNIHDDGFATLYTGLKNAWDPHGQYMELARKAAKRMKSFVRVIMLEKIKDLTDPCCLDQIKSDLENNIKIYICLYDWVKKKVPEPDFGIWDNRYTVVDPINWKTKKFTNFVINSTEKGLRQANEWKTEIMQNAYPVKNMEDIKKFLAKY